ncbi:I66 family serine proteinase inhibitor [Kitasatospora sp. NPDC097605]|uniref:I66 family serine proteinase inhibitor n=1 Tax=Kitasatospora sp. NPDC097605 TaxID=3157226 RepID=UPI00331B8A75
MSLDSGLYTIHNGEDPVGRALYETLDLSPKAVFNKTDDPDAVWVVEALPNGRHKLYAKGAPTAVEDNAPAGPVVALLIHQQDAEEWELAAVDEAAGTYRVRSSQGSVWLVPEPGKHGRIETLPIPGDDTGSATVFTFKQVDL